MPPRDPNNEEEDDDAEDEDRQPPERDETERVLQGLVWCHPLFRKLLDRLRVLRKMRKPHPSQHVRRLGELYIVVRNDLKAIAPRIAEVEERSGQDINARFGQRPANGVLVIDHKPEMATVVWRLFAAFLKREELVTQINERHILVFPAKLELEYPRVERQCFLDIAHFERNVIETHGARFLAFRHRTLHAVKELDRFAATRFKLLPHRTAIEKKTFSELAGGRTASGAASRVRTRHQSAAKALPGHPETLLTNVDEGRFSKAEGVQPGGWTRGQRSR
jgi:hypothetical protein